VWSNSSSGLRTALLEIDHSSHLRGAADVAAFGVVVLTEATSTQLTVESAHGGRAAVGALAVGETRETRAWLEIRSRTDARIPARLRRGS
jgi:hypothetical protein